MSALAIRNDLKSFYKAHRTECPGDNLTQVGNFTKKMLGDHSDKKLKTKGAETWVFFLFLLRKLQAVHSQVGVIATTMLKAGRELESMNVAGVE